MPTKRQLHRQWYLEFRFPWIRRTDDPAYTTNVFENKPPDMTIRDFDIKGGAEFSACRQYRYALWRIWDAAKPLIMFIGLNPSTANENVDDATIRRVKAITKNLGFGGMYMMNCFPLISTNPANLKSFFDSPSYKVEDEINMVWLIETEKICADVIFAWGNFPVAAAKGKELAKLFPTSKALHINKNGSPKHPLYCKQDTIPVKYKL